MSVGTSENKSKLEAPTKAELEQFFKLNSKAQLFIHEPGDEREFCVIRNPWNDETIGLIVPGPSRPNRELVSALNGLILPERLAAVYHVSEKTLEVPWTAQKLSEEQAEISGREFSLSFGSRKHDCSYSEASPQLRAIADNAVLYDIYTSHYRGLSSFVASLRPNDKKYKKPGVTYDKLLSFKVTNVEWNEPKVVELCKYINFYTRYYDSLAPEILIYEVHKEDGVVSKNRYVEGKFPDRIKGRELDSVLMSFWSAAARETDATRKFIYFYRIIEYVSFYHLDEQLKGSVRRALSDPSGASKTNEIGNRLIKLIRDAKTDEYGRFRSTISDLVDQKHVERIILMNTKYFATEQEFDGGFRLKQILPSSDTKTIGAFGMENFVSVLRDIRNALSHGRDQKTGQVILPTQKNFLKLLPWVSLIESAAAEVILYERVA